MAEYGRKQFQENDTPRGKRGIRKGIGKVKAVRSLFSLLLCLFFFFLFVLVVFTVLVWIKEWLRIGENV